MTLNTADIAFVIAVAVCTAALFYLFLYATGKLTDFLK